MLDNSEDSISAPQDSLRSKLIRLRMCRGDGGSRGTEGGGEEKKALVIDGSTLMHALDPSLRKLFLEVADEFHSVLCCRATPLQKVCVQLNLQVPCPYTETRHLDTPRASG